MEELIYVWQEMPKAHCPKCDKEVWWLRPCTEYLTPEVPSFFICKGGCGYAGQVGIGLVEIERG